MRAGTRAPSDAGIHTIDGAIHGCERHDAVVEVVSWASSAPGRFRIRYSSGGVLAREWTFAIHCSSGDSTPWWPPGCVVMRSRAPPATGIRQSAMSNGELSLVVR